MLSINPTAMLEVVALQVAWSLVREEHSQTTTEARTTLTVFANLLIPLSSFETGLRSERVGLKQTAVL